MEGLRTTNLIIRKMLPEDAVFAAEIENKSFSIPWSKQAFLDSLKLSYAVFLIAQLDEKVVGYCGLYQTFEQGDITNIAIHPNFRRQGIGKRLLQQMLEECSQKGIETVHLEVRESNRDAIELYKFLGFEKIGMRKKFYEKPEEDAVLMCRNL